MREAVAVVCVLWIAALLVLVARDRVERDVDGSYLKVGVGRWFVLFGRWRSWPR